jgi:predicted nucleic acid-binding protein
MQGTFLDTNIFLRHLLNDVPAQAQAARALIAAIESGSQTGWTTALAVAEIVFVLENPRTYGLDRSAIRDHVLPILMLPHLRIERKSLYPHVFELYVSTGIDYIDAYHAALIESYGQHEIYSFDHDFDAVAGLHRLEALP